jgi:hypothetical protein
MITRGQRKTHKWMAAITAFVLKIIDQGQAEDSKAMMSFVDILVTLQSEGFKIMAAVDWNAVSDSVSWIEFSEGLTE